MNPVRKPNHVINSQPSGRKGPGDRPPAGSTIARSMRRLKTVMVKLITGLWAKEIEGLVRTGILARLSARCAPSGLTARLVAGAAVIDLHTRPDLRWSSMELVFGTAVVGMALLWFRRSRRNQPKAQQEPPPPESAQEPEQLAAPKQVRPPLRIRGLLLLNLQPTDGTGQIETAPPLGSRDAVIRAVETAAPGVQFDDAGRGEVGGDDHRITIDVGREEPVYAAVASVEGDTGIDRLRTLMQRERWRAYAPRAGVFVEPDALDLFALPDSSPSRSRL